MSDTAQSQAIMFEPTDELELRAGRGEGAQDASRSLSSRAMRS